MKKIQKIAIDLFESKVDIHLVFITVFIGVFCSPAILSGIPVAKAIYMVIPGIFFLLCIYTGRLICRRWLMTTRINLYFINLIIGIIAFSTLGILESGHFTRNQSIYMVIAIVFVIAGFFMLGTFLSVTRSTVLRQIHEANVVQQQQVSELKLLRSQLSPHFLFNILNNLYGLSIRQDQKVPGLILKLSDLLRYSIYDTNRDFAPLAAELNYIDNYIELERTRIGDKLNLEISIQKNYIEDIKIAPMILIVFVENAFKHSKNTLVNDIHIKMNLQIIGDTLLFEIKNNYSDILPAMQSKDASGMGLTITKKRLGLLYPGSHSLETVVDKSYYMVKLQLKIK